ncbi:MAG: hypothetical protein COW01_06110 [Bdellovibrionales bacterium CG12_big_fil_rev_8_21_14_0_65_38_15]|nr:MAG: hypothetical protein COW79_04005 [Bdellovibrionales bacterium CG22_combo_CG10-13_8_21_14_all_38_13]PIQ56003.1 MAG: hypothetical protein COW01_06110 [Bdellovibrionales bacterium CG12_big_fil_rev_8_21_14_0_65_38_15]PIR30608.1 MAG: hypothetical protein COV38_04650 [Bdellovibrionales bacterium CG11_big_fil_rev_8_21_14_0_20_38_13]
MACKLSESFFHQFAKGEMKMRRSGYKIETPIAKALKNMRNAKSLSLVKTSRLLGVSESVINHHENGRTDHVPEDYIEHFVKTMGFSKEDWDDFLKGRTSVYDLRKECRELISKLDRDKLKAIHTMLLSFVGNK